MQPEETPHHDPNVRIEQRSSKHVGKGYYDFCIEAEEKTKGEDGRNLVKDQRVCLPFGVHLAMSQPLERIHPHTVTKSACD